MLIAEKLLFNECLILIREEIQKWLECANRNTQCSRAEKINLLTREFYGVVKLPVGSAILYWNLRKIPK